MVNYSHSRIINVPIKFAYEWCTDYSPEDSNITGSKYPRIVLEKTKKRAVYAGYKVGSDGEPKLAVRVVTLYPSKYSWHLDYFAEEDLEVGEYKLTKLGKDKTKLTMKLKNKWKKGKGPSSEEFEKGASAVWDKYVPAVERDYSQEQA